MDADPPDAARTPRRPGDDADGRHARLVVRVLDQLAAHAIVPAVSRPVDGWLLRATPDAPFRRASSVLPNGPLTETSFEAAMREVEEFYESRELPVRFQISEAAQPPDLDHRLERRGYEIETPVVVMTAGATIVLGRTASPASPASPPRSVRSTGSAGQAGAPTGRLADERGRRAWERANAALHGDVQSARERVLAYGRAMHALELPAVAAVAPAEPGDATSIGFAVAEQGWTGIFGMGTRPGHRRRGAATAVLHTLAEWAVEQDAPRLYLQVEEANTAARDLYARAGFVDAYGYHYRSRLR
jgi:GNAT superfamily N-acetyltransferase